MAGTSEEQALTGEEKSFVRAVVLVLIDAALWLVWLALVLFYVPHMEYVFRDFNMKVPWLTEEFLSTARWFQLYWYVLVPFFAVYLGVDGVIAFLLYWKPGTRWLARLWLILMLLLPLLTLVLSGLALYLPTIKLLEGLSR